jgi:hypothetical protein
MWATDPNLQRPVSWLPSMNLLVRRDTFVKVGGFNERLDTAEDVACVTVLGSLDQFFAFQA